ncbi:MAG TPA: biotin--[acetyl-CoA-carboxylase] ligase [Bryobacteraceae bacterium]|nr:biotin--[acetyl-CoA-carboxylase] ligase [Bryobacteraceae bacterium]
MTPIDAELLRRALPGRRIEYHAIVDSTMRAAAGLPLGSVILAEEQTAGQGRHGHSWHSEPGTGIYLSIVARPAPLVTMALGLATAEAITTATGIVCDLRWPNDVLIGDKKAAGILAQVSDGAAIGGIGINVNHAGFPPELAQIATSLRLESGREWPRTDLLVALIPAIDSFLALPAESILQLFTRASSYARGRRVVVQQKEGDIYGITAGLTDAGYLKVRQDNGTDAVIIAGGVRAASA